MISSYKYYPTYGVIDTKNNNVKNIYEKNFSFNINSGFYVLDNKIFDFIQDKNESFEKDVLPKLIKKKKKLAFLISKNGIQLIQYMISKMSKSY